MSMYLASQVWKYKLNKTELVILMALCDIADDDGTSCYPRARYVKWKTGSSIATVYRMIEHFQKRGVLELVGYRGETPEYTIHLDLLPMKPDYERKKTGRPRKNLSHGEKSFSPRETFRTTRNVSHSEKTPLMVRKVLSPREKFSHGENEQHRLDMPENEAGSGSVSKRDVSDPILLNHTNDPILEIHDASTKKTEKEKPAETAETRTAEPPTPQPPAPAPAPLTLQQEFTAWLARSEFSEVPGQRMVSIEKRKYEDRTFKRLSHQEVMAAFLASRQRQEVAV